MKTLFIVLLFTLPCYGQNFMMKMNVLEVYENITIRNDSIKVIWGINEEGDISFIWGNPQKMIYFRRKHELTSQKQREELHDMIERYKLQPDNAKSNKVKILGLFSDRNGDIYLVKVVMNDGVVVWIKKMNDKFPHYYFGMVHDKQKL